MKKQLVYDLPLRFFHWLFAGLFITAFLIAKTLDDESPLFSYHMLAGLMLGFIVILRIIWGVIGPVHSRFSDFALHPRDLVTYLTSLTSKEKRLWAGHHPASSWATLLMLALALGLGVTGFLMTSGSKKSFEDVHELLANAFLVVVLVHVAGVVMHAFRYRDGLALSMLNGTKEDIAPSAGIRSSYPVTAFLFLIMAAGFAFYLGRHFDPRAGTLDLLGSRLHLAEEIED